MDEKVTSKISNTDDEPGSSSEIETFTHNEVRVADDGLGPKWKLWKRRRYIVVIWAFLGQVIRESLRTNLSVAILLMTENHTTTDENGNTVYVRDFEWDVKSCGFLLSVFSYGKLSTLIFGGMLAMKYGGAKIFGLSIGITSLTTIFTPSAAYVHFYLLIALRIFEGICEGVIPPSAEYIYATWIPQEERSSLVGIIASGFVWGDIFAFVMSSAVSHIWGWPAIFYATGGIGIAWCFGWFIYVKENPRLEKKISQSERTYIEAAVRRRRETHISVYSVPYTKILTSVPMWALIVCSVATAFHYSLSITQLPAYIKDVLRQDTQKSGYLSSLPMLANMLTTYWASPLADFLINRRVFTTTTVRKIYICGSLTTIAITSFVIQQISSTTAAVACLVVMAITSGPAATQMLVNILDLAPSYSSVISGLNLTITALGGISAPTITGYLTQNKTAEEWYTVFSGLAVLCLIAAAIYGIFGSGELQPWATQKDDVHTHSTETEQ